MERSIATTPRSPGSTEVVYGPPPGDAWRRWRAGSESLGASISAALARIDPRWLGLALVVVALAVYMVSHTNRHNFYNHFVWQAAALLEGHFSIAFPVTAGDFQNGYFQDVMPLL
ncbi:MAG TPA: hypothetical protein VH741_08750, partial [Candidatus Limnocylindrales bacterium]